MIISRFNRYFDKHGRKTYIVLGIIISLMFVVFVTPGSIFGGRTGSNNLGTMYGKKLKRQEITKKMSETYVGICMRYPHAFGQDIGNDILFHETLNRMRILHEAKKMNIGSVSNNEIAQSIHNNMLFQENGKFSAEIFQNFREGFLLSRGIAAVDFDRIIKENIIIERIEKQISSAAVVDEDEVNSYVEKYSAKFADFGMDLMKDSKPSEEEINNFFIERKSEIQLPDSKSALIAAFNVDEFLSEVSASPADSELKKRVEPSEAEIKEHYDSLKERIYKDKDLSSVSAQITRTLRSRNARIVLEERGNSLREKFLDEVKGEDLSARLQRFKLVAEELGAKVLQSGLLSGGDQISGLPGRQTGLVNAIVSLDKKGAVSNVATTATVLSVACLTDIQATMLPAVINKEVEDLIVDKLLAEKALALYKEKAAPYAELATTVNNRNELANPEFEKIHKNSALSDEEKQLLVSEYQEELSDYVYPFFQEAKRSFALVSFKPESFMASITEQDVDMQTGYAKRAEEYQKKEIRLAKIVVKTSELSEQEKDAKKVKLQEALKKIQEGTTFLEIAKEYSEEESHFDTELQDIKRLTSKLAEAVTEMQSGEISDVIETDDSLLIVQVLERRDGRTLEDVYDELLEILRKEKSIQLAYEAALDFATKASDRWWKDTENNLEFEGIKILPQLSEEIAEAEFNFYEQLPASGLYGHELSDERALLQAVFETSLKEPLTRAIKGEKASYLACLEEVVAPSLRNPELDSSALGTMKSIYRRKTAQQKAKERALLEKERIEKALSDGSEFNEAADKTIFSDLAPFSRMETEELSKTARLNDINASLQALSKAKVETILEPQKTYNGYALIYLSEKNLPNDEDSLKMMENVRNYILRREEQKLMAEFYERIELESDTRLLESLQTRNR